MTRGEMCSENSNRGSSLFFVLNVFFVPQRVSHTNSLPVPAVGRDRLPTHNALHVPPDSGGGSGQLWASESGAEHQPDVHRTAGEESVCMLRNK